MFFVFSLPTNYFSRGISLEDAAAVVAAAPDTFVSGLPPSRCWTGFVTPSSRSFPLFYFELNLWTGLQTTSSRCEFSVILEGDLHWSESVEISGLRAAFPEYSARAENLFFRHFFRPKNSSTTPQSRRDCRKTDCCRAACARSLPEARCFCRSGRAAKKWQCCWRLLRRGNLRRWSSCC